MAGLHHTFIYYSDTKIVLKRANSYLKILEILQYFLDFSEKIDSRKRKWYVLNSNQFGKLKKINGIVIENNQSKEKILEFAGPTRKVFRNNVKELLKNKLITEIKTSDHRSHYYSITPWGICYLIKSEYLRDPQKVTNPERRKIFYILETFATLYVKPYKSEIFRYRTLNFNNLYWRLAPEIIDGHDLGEEMPYTFTNFEESKFVGLQFWLDVSYTEVTKLPIANFRFNENEIVVSELGQREGAFSEYIPIKLNEEQFHHYFANMLIFLTVYFHAKLEHDSILRGIKTRKTMAKRVRCKPDIDDYLEGLQYYRKIPDDFLQILFIFNNSLVKIIKKENNSFESFIHTINQTQYDKPIKLMD